MVFGRRIKVIFNHIGETMEAFSMHAKLTYSPHVDVSDSCLRYLEV
jgi:hypothetical protein